MTMLIMIVVLVVETARHVCFVRDCCTALHCCTVLEYIAQDCTELNYIVLDCRALRDPGNSCFLETARKLALQHWVSPGCCCC